MMITRNKKILKGLTLEELQGFCSEEGEPKYRAKQIFSWMYDHLANSFDEMQNLPKPLREKLTEISSLTTLTFVTSEVSSSTGTKKYIQLPVAKPRFLRQGAVLPGGRGPAGGLLLQRAEEARYPLSGGRPRV